MRIVALLLTISVTVYGCGVTVCGGDKGVPLDPACLTELQPGDDVSLYLTTGGIHKGQYIRTEGTGDSAAVVIALRQRDASGFMNFNATEIERISRPPEISAGLFWGGLYALCGVGILILFLNSDGIP